MEVYVIHPKLTPTEVQEREERVRQRREDLKKCIIREYSVYTKNFRLCGPPPSIGRFFYLQEGTSSPVTTDLCISRDFGDNGGFLVLLRIL